MKVQEKSTKFLHLISVVVLGGLLFGLKFVKETKGKELEEIS